MTTQCTNYRWILFTLVFGGWLLSQYAAAAGSNAVVNVDRMVGEFTITDFKIVNGVSEAIGMIAAKAIDSEGRSVDILTNVPVRLPVVLEGTLAQKASILDDLTAEFVPPPTLSSNLCTILAISIEFVDVVIPGLGLNVHVNQLLLGIRADRDTRLGDVLCTLLGDDPGATNAAAGITRNLNIRLDGAGPVVAATGPGTLQATTSLQDPTWTNVLTLGPTAQTLIPTGPAQFFRLALSTAAATQASKGGFSLGSVNGVFTVADFRSVNGTSMAAGWLTGNVTDPTEVNEVGLFTNFPVRLPVSGVLAGNPVDVGDISTPVILPQLSTNTCSLLGIVVGAIDVTIPGLGLNLHVNQISIVVRADRETTVGDLLCTLLGDDLLGAAALTSPGMLKATILEENESIQGSSADAVTAEQLRTLAGLVLGSKLSSGTDTVASQPNSKAKGKGSAKKKTDPDVGLLQTLLQRAILTMDPSASLPKTKPTKPAKSKAP